jgi:hypothetical protein
MNPPNPLQSFIKERKDVLLCIYQENRTHARHHEGQISTASNIIIISTLGLVGVMANDHCLNWKDWPLSCSLILIGLYGAMFTKYHFECICRCKKRSDKYRQVLDDLLFKNAEHNQPTLEEIHNVNDSEHDKRFPEWCDVPLIGKFRVLWPLTISLIGIGVTLYVFIYWHQLQCTG